MCAQKLSFDYAHTLHTVRIVHNAHSVHRSRVQKGKSCDCINFVRATDPTCGSGGFLIKAFEYVREKIEADVKSQKEKLRASIEGDDFDSKSEKEQIKISDKIDEVIRMLKNNIEVDVKIKCIEAGKTQAQLGEMIGSTGQYVNRIIKKGDGVINKTFVEMLDALGYDIQLTYVKKEEA